MGRLILVTGGARSGKSSFAEKKAIETGNKILYVATSIPFDDEMKFRIKMHRLRRPSGWLTVEAYKNLDKAMESFIDEADGVLLDCVTVMVTNLMMDSIGDFDNISHKISKEAEELVDIEIGKLLDFVERTDKTFLIVTNEVGMGIVPVYPSARLFRDVAGRTNQKLAKAAAEAYFCVSGIPVRIK